MRGSAILSKNEFWVLFNSESLGNHIVQTCFNLYIPWSCHLKFFLIKAISRRQLLKFNGKTEEVSFAEISPGLRVINIRKWRNRAID